MRPDSPDAMRSCLVCQLCDKRMTEPTTLQWWISSHLHKKTAWWKQLQLLLLIVKRCRKHPIMEITSLPMQMPIGNNEVGIRANNNNRSSLPRKRRGFLTTANSQRRGAHATRHLRFWTESMHNIIDDDRLTDPISNNADATPFMLGNYRSEQQCGSLKRRVKHGKSWICSKRISANGLMLWVLSPDSFILLYKSKMCTHFNIFNDAQFIISTKGINLSSSYKGTQIRM